MRESQARIKKVGRERHTRVVPVDCRKKGEARSGEGDGFTKVDNSRDRR